MNTKVKLTGTKVNNKVSTKTGKKVDTKKVVNNVTKKVNKVTYLKQGVTGKQLTKQKIDGNRSNKDELKSISFNLKQINKHSKDMLNSLKLNKKDITPANLLPLRTVKEITRMENNGGLVTFWLIESLIIRYAKSLVK